MMMKKIWIVIACLFLVGCEEGRVLDDYNTPIADPGKIQTEFILYDPVPVLAARFVASDAGYEIIMYRTFGTPSSTIIQSRDVAVRVFDWEGKVLSAVSVENPREVHTVGARDPETAVMPMATFTVFFAEPLEIRALEVEVINGVNSGLEQSFEVEPKTLKEFDIGGP